MTHLTILGGGPAGLGVAFYAHRAGLPFELYEGSPELGGMCRTLRSGDHLYDRGAHRFHDRDPEITRDVAELMGDELVRVVAGERDPRRRTLHRLSSHAPQRHVRVRIREAGRICLDLVRAGWRRHATAVTFEDFAVRRFGKTLARRILLNYSAKLWGLPTDQLSPDIATRRLQGMTLRSLLYELVFPGGKTEHIDGSFLYPRGGYGRITDALAGTLPPESIHTGFAVERLECSGDGAVRRIHFSGGRTREVEDRLVSTLPLPFLVGLLGDALPEPAREAASRLRFRHVRLLFLRLAKPRVSERASIYIPDPAFCVSRICEPKNRSSAMTPENETSLIVEAPCFRGDAVERLSDEEFTGKVVAELSVLGLVEPKEVLETRAHFIPNAYPVCANGYAHDVGVIREALASVGNLETLGRAGRFVYSHLHDQLRFGKDCVRRLIDSRRADTA